MQRDAHIHENDSGYSLPASEKNPELHPVGGRQRENRAAVAA